jgi:hypothetical protein
MWGVWKNLAFIYDYYDHYYYHNNYYCVYYHYFVVFASAFPCDPVAICSTAAAATSSHALSVY